MPAKLAYARLGSVFSERDEPETTRTFTVQKALEMGIYALISATPHSSKKGQHRREGEFKCTSEETAEIGTRNYSVC
jgi:hypothetical protein